MAKDVDLSSKEWCDIVFEGKNKEFGAYKLREDSVRRHTKASIIVISVLAAILAILILIMTGVIKFSSEDDADANTEQEVASQYEGEEEEAEEEDLFIEEDIPEPEIEEIFEEDLQNQERVTDILIVEEKDFKEENAVKEQTEIMETTAAFGSMDVSDGVDDRTKTLTKEQVVVVDKPVEEKPKPKQEEIHTIATVEQKPQFPGGETAMYKWLSDHINYPAAAAEEGIDGKVTVQFVVGKDGSISNVKVVRGKHPALDAEAIRVVKAMPKWQPGVNNGQPVKVAYTLPVTFKLQH